MSRRFTVLISSAGTRVHLLRLFRRAMDRLGLDGRVIATDLSPMAPAVHLADAWERVPRCTAPEFVPALQGICAAHAVDLVVPTIDPELAPLAAHRGAFEAAGTRVHVGSPEMIAVGSDKLQTHAWLVANGLPTVRQTTAEAALADPEGWPFPWVIKPSGGSASIGVARVTGRDEVELALSRPTAGVLLAQSVAPGVEYTVSVFVDDGGAVRSAVPRRRHEVRAGEVTKASTVRVGPVAALASRVAAALPGCRGHLNVQIFHDAATDQLAVIEINPRFGGGCPLAIEAGADSPRWLIEEQLGLPRTASDDWVEGMVLLRYLDAVLVRPDDPNWPLR